MTAPHGGVRPRPTQRPSYRWVVLAVGFIGVFGGVGLGRFGYSAILPSMQEGLQISSAAAGALASWNFGGYLVMAALSGILAYRFGPRLVVGIGSVLAAVGMLLTGLAEGVVSAAAARLLTGLGGGLVFVPSVALMSSWFGVRQRGMASGIAASGPALAMIIAGPVVPAIVAAGGSDGWRIAWYLFAGLTAFVGLMTLVLQRNYPYDPAPVPASRPASDNDLESPVGPPLAPRRVLRSRHAWLLALIYASFGFAYMIYITFFQKRLTYDLGLSAQTAGRLFLLVGVLSLICGFLWGAISDRLGRGLALFMNLLLQGVSAVLFAWWPTPPGVVVSAVLCGLTAVAIPGVIGASCGDKFGARLASTALGFVTLFLGLGQLVGPYLAGYAADAFGTLKYSYLLAAGVFFLATVLSLFVRDHSARASSR